MATKTIRIGSLKNIHQYDDGDYNKSIEVEDPIRCIGDPVDPDDLVKKHYLDDSVNAGVQNVDGGLSNSNYGGIMISPLDGGNSLSF